VTVTSPPHPDPARRSWRFLASPGWFAAILGALAFTTVCWTVLAPWQFSRNAERSLANAQVAAAVNAAPRPVEELLPMAGEPDPDSTWQPATATGSFEPEHQVFVRLRQDAGGAPASEVLVPLRLADGSAVLIDRGYVPATDTDPAAPLPTGTVTVTGRVQPDQPDPLHRPAQVTDGRTEVLGIEAGAIPDLAGPVRHGFLQLMNGSPAVLNPIVVPQADSGPFLSYALQWCAFGAMALLAIGFFVIREYHDHDPRPVEPPPAAVAAVEVRPPAPAGPTRPVPTTDRRPGGRRQKFDRSQLYDRDDSLDPR
jgi:cytochrome oxidase assembly protein ShyY1